MEGVWAVPVPFLVGSTIYLPVEHLLPGGMFLAAVGDFHRRFTETPLLPLGLLTQSPVAPQSHFRATRIIF